MTNVFTPVQWLQLIEQDLRVRRSCERQVMCPRKWDLCATTKVTWWTISNTSKYFWIKIYIIEFKIVSINIRYRCGVSQLDNFRGVSEMYLGPCQTSMMELFWENYEQCLTVLILIIIQLTLWYQYINFLGVKGIPELSLSPCQTCMVEIVWKIMNV